MNEANSCPLQEIVGRILRQTIKCFDRSTGLFNQANDLIAEGVQLTNDTRFIHTKTTRCTAEVDILVTKAAVLAKKTDVLVAEVDGLGQEADQILSEACELYGTVRATAPNAASVRHSVYEKLKNAAHELKLDVRRLRAEARAAKAEAGRLAIDAAIVLEIEAYDMESKAA